MACMAGVEQSVFIGQFTDDPTALSYLNARYYDPGRAGFLSQDPVHLAVGDGGQIRQLVQRDQNQLLMDPQQLNSYSYARGNPIVLKDPEGRLAFLPLVGYILAGYSAAQIGVDTYDTYNTNVRYGGVFTQAEKNRTNFKALYDVGTAGVGLAARVPQVGMSAFGDMLNFTTGSIDILDQYGGAAIYKQYNDERGPFEGSVRAARNIDLSKNKTVTFSTSRPFISVSNQGNLRGSSNTASSGSNRYSQLVNSLNQLVSSLSALVSSLSSKKN